MIHIIGVELFHVNLRGLRAEVDPFGDARCGHGCRGVDVSSGRRWGYAARLQLLLVVLLDEGYLAHLIAYILNALLLKLAHEGRISANFLQEGLFVDAIELATRVADADERGHVHLRLGHQDIFQADNAARAQLRNLVGLVLLASALRAHCLALTGQLAGRFFGLLEHLTRVEPLDLPGEADANLTGKEAAFDDVDVLHRVVLVEDDRTLDASEDLQGLAYVL